MTRARQCPVGAGFRKQVDTLLPEHRERATPFSGDANPDLVRVVGCSPDQSAYELPSKAFGGRTHGALTAALVPVLTSPAASASTWRDVLDIVRRQVTGLVPGQRPRRGGP